jgi:hypothetical protein
MPRVGCQGARIRPKRWIGGGPVGLHSIQFIQQVVRLRDKGHRS